MFLNIGMRASVVGGLAAKLLLFLFKKIYGLVIPTAAASGAVLIAGILDIPVISTLVHQDIPVVPYQSHQYAITLVPSIGYSISALMSVLLKCTFQGINKKGSTMSQMKVASPL